MSRMVEDFFDTLGSVAGKDNSVDHRLATVDPAYTTGDPKVTFDGETVLSTKTYKATVPVLASARVVMSRVGNTWVVSGVLSGGPEFLRKGEATSGGSGGRNTKAMTNGTLNANLTSGWYDGANVTGAPDGNWWLIQVIAHSNGAHWQRQIAYSMTTEGGPGQTVYSRRCNGGDPTIAGSWSSWIEITQAPSRNVGYIRHTSNYGGPSNSRFRVPMTDGTSDDGRRPLYRAGDVLACRVSGWYEFTGHAHTHSTLQGIHSIEVRRLYSAGGELVIGLHYQNGEGGTRMVPTGPVEINGGDTVDLVLQSPDGVSYNHYGLAGGIRGKYLGPA